jgi:molybdopterin converting factor subunit 1
MTGVSARCTILYMTVDVFLFASYAETLGGPRVSIDLEPGATVRDVLAQLRRLPGAERLPPAPMIAVNHRYAHSDDIVTAGDEIAVIPPVAGG